MKRLFLLIIISSIIIMGCVTTTESESNDSTNNGFKAEEFTVVSFTKGSNGYELVLSHMAESIPDGTVVHIMNVETKNGEGQSYQKGKSKYLFRGSQLPQSGDFIVEIGLLVPQGDNMKIRSAIMLEVTPQGLQLTEDYQESKTSSSNQNQNDESATNISFKKTEDFPNIFSKKEFDLIPAGTITKADGLSDSFVRNIYVNGDSIYAATKDGINISKDAGDTWNQALPYHHVWDIHGEGSLIAAALREHGMVVSTDAGETWTEITTDNGLASNDLKAVFVKDGRIYAGTMGGLCILENDDGNWIRKQKYVPPSNHIKSIFIDDKGTLFVSSFGGGLNISDTSGEEWKVISGLQSLVQVRASGDNILLASWGEGAYISSDYGEYWSPIASRIPHLQNEVLLEIDGTILLAGKGGLYLSRDGGRSWETSSEPLFTMNYALSLVHQNDKLYVGTSEGIAIFDLILK